MNNEKKNLVIYLFMNNEKKNLSLYIFTNPFCLSLIDINSHIMWRAKG